VSIAYHPPVFSDNDLPLLATVYENCMVTKIVILICFDF